LTTRAPARNDPTAIADATRRLLGDGKLAPRIDRAAREEAERLFGVEMCASPHLDARERALERRAHRH
jgi:hypothetical protein